MLKKTYRPSHAQDKFELTNLWLAYDELWQRDPVPLVHTAALARRIADEEAFRHIFHHIDPLWYGD